MDTLHSYKFHNTALFDYLATIMCVFVITHFTDIPLSLVTILLFILSIPLHYLFNVTTPTNKYLLLP